MGDRAKRASGHLHLVVSRVRPQEGRIQIDRCQIKDMVRLLEDLKMAMVLNHHLPLRKEQ
jgi:hypothetical protein